MRYINRHFTLHFMQPIGNENQPAGDRCGRMQRKVDIMESRCWNGPQLSMLSQWWWSW